MLPVCEGQVVRHSRLTPGRAPGTLHPWWGGRAAAEGSTDVAGQKTVDLFGACVVRSN